MDNSQLYRDDAPDIETASQDYASRFAGPAGDYLLGVQEHSVAWALEPFRGGSLVEFGGGHGQLRKLYRNLQLTVTLHGSHESCFTRLPRADRHETRIVSDLRRVPLGDRSVDVALAVRLLSHLEDWPRVLNEMCRVARYAVVVDYPSLRSINALTPLLFAIKKRIEKNTRTYFSFTRRRLASVLTPAGFPVMAEYRQFLLPMGVHRLSNANRAARAAEHAARSMGLTRALGSPVVLRAVRNKDTA